MIIDGVNRIGPLIKWGVSGLCAGAGIGAVLFVVNGPGFPKEPSAKAAQVGAAVGGIFGLVAGVLVVLGMVLVDRNRYDIKKRQAAEHKDPNIVPELYQDIADGYDTEAWHAIGLLADYQDAGITTQMLETMEHRLTDKEVYTTDPGALVRHAVKSIIRTKHIEGMEALKPYARDFESRLGIEVRRLKRDLKEINKATSSSGSA
jgi:hypothetical protein